MPKTVLHAGSGVSYFSTDDNNLGLSSVSQFQYQTASFGVPGCIFRIKERASLQVRGEFTNMFNRTEMNNPTGTNALATPTRNTAGQTTGGFGYINTGTVFSAPRQGQLVARFQF